MAKRNYAEPAPFSLPQGPPNKTIDIGCNGTTISADALGRILQLSAFHPVHGIMVSVPFEQFDGSKFKNPNYVREYRAKMLEYMETNKSGFGLDLEGDVESVSIQRIGLNTACFRYTLKGDSLEVTYTIKALDGGGVIQTATLTNKTSRDMTQQVFLNLSLSLNRASYGQLTEGGPIPPPVSRNIFKTTENTTFSVTNPHLGALIEAGVELDGKPLKLDCPKDRQEDVTDSPLDIRADAHVDIPPGQIVTLEAKFRLTPHIEPRSRGDGSALVELSIILEDPKTLEWRDEKKLTTYIIRRNVDYILSNCTVPISDTEVAVITDHVALPLGWNRDNYWQIRFLLETYKSLGRLVESNSIKYYQEQIRKVAKGHLHWVFNKAERPGKYWGRSYLVTGKQKDQLVFQLDQQCYPFLELCDYLEIFPNDEDVKSLADSSAITEVLEFVETKRDEKTDLYTTDETPADDPVKHPYHFSSHVLLWRTYTRLTDLWKRIKPDDTERAEELASVAKRVRKQTMNSFLYRDPKTDSTMFVYGINGKAAELYYDGNDVPTLFAEEWGFVKEADEISAWQHTMDFGLSSQNKKGFCDGKYPGLGSQHSPGAWVLGYFQEMAYAVRTDQEGRLKAAWRKITAAMQWDGTFSEAVDTDTAKCSSKAWFSWPGSMIGALLIQMIVEGKLGALS